MFKVPDELIIMLPSYITRVASFFFLSTHDLFLLGGASGNQIYIEFVDLKVDMFVKFWKCWKEFYIS